ncbi:MAG TPA: hypothetical protein VNM90_12410, partial [Haliangium sp.]|nr:hypothetical protein [Haliangium sp.]
GGVLGATAIEPGTPTASWLTGPIIGAGSGLVIGGVPALVMAMNGRDRLARQFFWWSMVTGISGGLLFGLLTQPDDPLENASVRGPVMMLSPPWQF